jgi:hypothetical protein
MESCGSKNDIECASAQPARVIGWVIDHQFKCEATARQAIHEFQIFPCLPSLPTEKCEHQDVFLKIAVSKGFSG